MTRTPRSAEERRDLVRRLLAAGGQSTVRIDAAEEIVALAEALAPFEGQPSAAEALDQAEAAVDEAIRAAEHALDPERERDDVLDFLRVELGLVHPQGAHHRPPGFAEAVERLLAD